MEDNILNKKININFIDGPFVKIIEDTTLHYKIEFIDRDDNKIIFEIDLISNKWAKCSKKYFVNWLIKIKGIDNDFYYEHTFDLNKKRVFVFLESHLLGDTLAWIDQVDRFRIKNKCEVICATSHNNIFKEQYPNIQFTSPTLPKSNESDFYALYRLGVWRINDVIDMDRHKIDPRKLPLIQVGSDILGINYKETKPKLANLGKTKQKLVTIGFHGGGQFKYWNNPTGWQEVVNFLNLEGYEVRLLSNEEDGYMGNRPPNGITKQPNGPLSEIIKVLQESVLFIGISSGLSWLSWAAGTPTIIISGFTDIHLEPINGITRIINKDVCNSCWSKYEFKPHNWYWCPVYAGTENRFECSKSITGEVVIKKVKNLINNLS
jgi:autotransporter strand-loop-strand O-heptosyltransferase